MAGQTVLGVSLKFSADVSAAKRSMAELQTSLAQINNASMNSKIGTKYTADLNQASQAAAQLRIQLQNAFNQDTGKLNLIKFNQEMKQSGMTLEKYRQQLTMLGPQGEQAFNRLAYSIATAETKTFSLGAGIKRLGATFMNTLRYQLSSTVIMGFVQGISEAVTYVKDLNTSLNNIRIVTGYGVDEMEKFAAQANKAAKSLSTTTKAMTDASLIYFQQGLNMKEAQARAEVTVKMANVTGKAVEEVSDQLTAVWNNFYDGSKSLEYYADVITALGAATASSTDEISEGLQKFAAIADTVGLSYEYATTALATVTATTRQSADVVGTAFKTLFARIQDLELGETLDDGVTLGKYSQGLAAVGVNILDAKGGLKDMNTILNEMGAKWDSLSKAQQVSLAQTVAGVRQYTQLIALMDNWDYFQENLSVAEASTGELTRQQEIYAESWEGASQRVKAAAEQIYTSLLNDDVFIDMMNGFSSFLGFLDQILDTLGGLPGILSIVGTALLRAFGPEIAAGANAIASSFMGLTKGGRAYMAQQKEYANNAIYDSTKAGGMEGIENDARRRQADMRQTYTKNAPKMTDSARAAAEVEMGARDDAYNEYFNSDKYKNNKEWVHDADIEAAKARKTAGNTALFDKGIQQARQAGAASTLNAKFDLGGEAALTSLGDGAPTTTQGIEQQSKSLTELESRLRSIGAEAGKTSAQLQNVVGDNVAQEYSDYASKVQAAKQALEELKQAEASGDQNAIGAARAKYGEAVGGIQEQAGKVNAAIKATEDQAQATMTEAMDGNKALATEIVDGQQAAGQAIGETASDVGNLNQRVDGATQGMENAGNAGVSFGEKVQQGAQMAMTMAMALNAIRGIIQTLNNDDMSFGEKLLSIFTSVAMVLPMVISSFRSLNIVEGLNNMGKNMAVAAEKRHSQAKGESTVATKIETEAIEEQNRALITNKNLKNTPDGGQVPKGNGGKAPEGGGGQQGGLSAGGLKALGTVAAYAAAIAAVLVVIVAIVQAVDKWKNGTENAAKAAKKGAADAAEAFKKVNEEYNNLKQSITDYKDIRTSMAKLTKGTQEYADALFEANEKALELIKNHSDLKYIIDSDGLIVFEDGELERVQKLQAQERAEAQAASLKAAEFSRQADIEVSKEKIAREKLHQSYSGATDEDKAAQGVGGAIGTGAGAITGGIWAGVAMGAAAGPLGILIGAAAGLVAGAIGGAIAGDLADNDATDQETEALDAIYEQYEKMGSAALTKEGIADALRQKGITDPKLIEELAENKDALTDLMTEMEANTAATRAATLQAATAQANALDPTLEHEDDLVKKAVYGAQANIREQLDDNINLNPDELHKSKWYTLGIAEGKTGLGEDIFNRWAAETMQQTGAQSIKAHNYGDDKVVYKIIDKEGKEEKLSVTYAQLAAWEEANQIDGESAKRYDAMRKAISDLQDIKNGEGLMSILAGEDLMSLNEKEFEAFKADFKNNNSELHQYINSSWEELGYKSAEAFLSAIDKQIQGYDPEKALAAFREKTNAEIATILDAGSKETEYTTGALKNYTEALQDNTKYLSENTDEWDKLEKKKLAAKAAVANAKFVKGVQALSKELDENLDVLNEWDEASMATWEAADKVQTALKDVFGVRVSADFVKTNLSEIKALAEGSTEGLEELSRAAAEDFALNLDTASEENRNWFAALLNQFADMANSADEIQIGMSLDDDEYISRLNEMLTAGEITAEQIEGAFGAIGYAPDIKYRTDTQKTRTTHYVWEPGADTSSRAAAKTIVSETESTVQVPYIAGKNTKSDIIENVDGTITGSQSSGSGFTLNRDVGSLNASLDDINKPDKKTEKPELDRYHEVNEIISDLEREYSKLEKIKKKAYGKKHIDAIGQEISKTKELIAANERLQQEAEDYLQTDKAGLAKFGAQFDEQGRVSNFEELQDQYATWYANKMNSNLGDTSKEKVKQVWQDFQNAVAQYEKTLNQLEETEVKITDKENQVLDLILEAITYQVDSNVQIAEDAITNLEYQIDHLYDKATKAAESIVLIGQKMEASMTKSNEYRQGIDLIFDSVLNDEEYAKFMETGDLSLLDGKLNADQLKQLRTYMEGLREENENLYTYQDEYFEVMTGSLETWNKEFEKTGTQIEFLSSTLDTYKNVIDLVGQKNLGVSYETMHQLAQQQVDMSLAATQAAKEQLDFNEESLKKLKEQRDIELSEENTKDMSKEELDYLKSKWDETIETAEEKVRESAKAVQTSWVDALTAASESFETSVSLAADAFEESMSRIYGSFESLQSAFDQANKANERYVAAYEKTYELSKLNRDIIKSIDNTDSVAIKQDLKDLQSEINFLQESEAEMSKYSLEYLRKKYELRVAEIALEDAQLAKTQVRMQRDLEGNWSYVYTADQDNIAKAQQDYEDKLYTSQQHTQQRISELQSLIVENEQQMLEELRALIPGTENYEAEHLRITKYYTEQETYLYNELQQALGNSKEIYEEDWKAYAQKTGYKLVANEQWVDSWHETVLAQVSGFDSLEERYNTFRAATEQLTTDISGYYATWQTNVSEAFRLAGESADKFGGDGEGSAKKALENVNKALDDLLYDLSDGKNGLAAKATKAFDDMIQAAVDRQTKYANALSPFMQANGKLIEQLQSLLGLQGQVGNMKSMYYGTIKGADGKIYRSEKTFETQQAAMDWATETAERIAGEADAIGMPKRSTDIIRNSAGVVDQLKGYEYSSVLPDYSPKSPTGPINPDSLIPGGVVNGDDVNEYLGTFYDENGQLVTTRTAAATEEEAKELARKEREEYLEHAVNKKRIEAAKEGKGFNAMERYKLKVDLERKMESYGQVGAVSQKGNKIAAWREVKVPNIFQFTIGDTTHAIVEGKYKLQGVRKDNGDVELYINSADGKTRLIDTPLTDPSQIQNLIKSLQLKFGKNDAGLKDAVSPSGDLFVQDPPLEVEDLVKDETFLKLRPDIDPQGTAYHKNPSRHNGVITWTKTKIKNLPGGYLNYTAQYNDGDGMDKDGTIYIRFFEPGNDKNWYWFPLSDLETYDTGGYTGTWDTTGRLAMLHQKEIILNAHDTENFLSAVNIVRDIASMIDLKAASQQHALAQLAQAQMANSTVQTLQQEVTIHAEFPNATQRSEIEAAFDTLLNRASQFANRKK